MCVVSAVYGTVIVRCEQVLKKKTYYITERVIINSGPVKVRFPVGRCEQALTEETSDCKYM